MPKTRLDQIIEEETNRAVVRTISDTIHDLADKLFDEMMQDEEFKAAISAKIRAAFFNTMDGLLEKKDANS
jgi:hypothetical protein